MLQSSGFGLQTNAKTELQARSKQCLIGPAITKLSAGDLGAG